MSDQYPVLLKGVRQHDPTLATHTRNRNVGAPNRILFNKGLLLGSGIYINLRARAFSLTVQQGAASAATIVSPHRLRGSLQKLASWLRRVVKAIQMRKLKTMTKSTVYGLGVRISRLLGFQNFTE